MSAEWRIIMRKNVKTKGSNALKRVAAAALMSMLVFSFTACTAAEDEEVKKVGTVDDGGQNGENQNGADGGANSNNDAGGEEGKDESNTQNENQEFQVGYVVETKSLRISYLSKGDYVDYSEFDKPKEGYKYIRAEFEFENIGKDDEYVSDMDFNCYADGYDMENKYLSEGELSATISSGRKAKGYVAFEVPVDAQDIVLEYEINMFDSKKIVFRYQ